MNLIPEGYGAAYAITAGAVVGTIQKMIPPEVQKNLYRFAAISLVSVILSRSAEALITKTMGEEDENASMSESLKHTYIKMFVPAISTGALGYLVARSGRISEEPVTVATVSFTAACINCYSRLFLSPLFTPRREVVDYKDYEVMQPAAVAPVAEAPLGAAAAPAAEVMQPAAAVPAAEAVVGAAATPPAEAPLGAAAAPVAVPPLSAAAAPAVPKDS